MACRAARIDSITARGEIAGSCGSSPNARAPDPYVPWHLPRSLFYTIGPGEASLPAIQADLHAVFAVDEKHVWIAGNNLLIAHSTDGGVTWQRARVDVPYLTPVPPTP